MDNETKILLNRLIEEVEKLNSPDWWIIVLTAINTIAVVVIAFMQIKIQIQQTKLQKRQTEAQEYELYKKLASTIKRIHLDVQSIIPSINYYLTSIDTLQNNKIWEKEINNCVDLSRQLNSCKLDLELKFSQKFIDIEAYLDVLISMVQLFEFHEMLLRERKITTTEQIITINKKPYIEPVKKIAEQVSEEYQEMFLSRLTNFLNKKDCINEEETMQKIKQHCKID